MPERTYTGPLARGRVWLPNREVPFARGEPGVVLHQRDIGLQDRAVGQFKNLLKEKRRHGLAADAVFLCGRLRRVDIGLHPGSRDLVLLGNGIGDERAADDAEASAHTLEAGDGFGAVEAQWRRKRRMPRPECRHDIRAKADHRDAARFQNLQRLLNVEDRLGAGGHDDDRRPRQFVEIG